MITLVIPLGSPVSATEPDPQHYGDPPPINVQELDALRKRVEKVRKRLGIQREPKPAQPAREPDPLPLPSKDERDGLPDVDFQELNKIRKEFENLRRSILEQEEERQPEGAPQRKPSPESPVGSEPGPPAGSEVERQIEALSQRVKTLERAMVGTEETPGLLGLIGGQSPTNGFFLASGDGNFFLRLGMLLQSDLRTFPGGQNGTNPGVRPSTFIVQRLRPMVQFRIARYFWGFMTPDFGNGFSTAALNGAGKVFLPSAFMEWDYLSAFKIRVGKFKSPIGLEMLQAPQNLNFMERSLTRNLLPNRDLGAMARGLVDHGLVEYQLGVFNGAPNANFFEETAASSSDKTAIARLFLRPFLHRPASLMHGFGIGMGFSDGVVKQGSGQDPMQTETFSYTFFQYKPNVTGDGPRERFAPQVAWYWWRFGLLGEYVRSYQELRAGTGPTVRTTNDAWSGQIAFFLTDDTATFGHVEPRRPFDIGQRQWGAWQVAVRFAQINIDPRTFIHGLADPTFNAKRAKSTTVGLNWYLNSNVRMTGNFVHTDFTGASGLYRAANHENGLLFRMQLFF